MLCRGLLLSLCALLLIPQTVSAQGFLLPDHDHDHRWRLPRHHPHRPIRPEIGSVYRIKDISINSKIENQVAQTQVSQTFVNNGNRQIQASFVFPLPYDGAVDRMTFMVDGKEYEAKLLPADKAREIYEGYMRRNQDPALLEWMGHGIFKTSVFPIPPGAARTVTLRYTQLLRKDQQLVDYLIPLSTAKYTAQPIESFSVRAAINTKGKIKNIYSPTHDVDIERSGDNLANFKMTRQNFIPANDMRILYSTDDRAIGASLLSYWPNSNEDGYFVLLASPDIKQNADEQPRKTVIFVVDRSGSMNGKKIEQAKEAAKFILNNLREGDLFNIIAYDREVEMFQPELQRYDEKTGNQARGFIEGIFAGGSTNIDQALTSAFGMIHDHSTPTYVLFLTDGLPTAGETSESKIAAQAKQNNQHGARLVSFGVGYDVNSRLLDRLTRDNRGQSQYVRPDEDLEEHVSRLYSKISAPVLTDVKIDYVVDGDGDPAVKAVNRVYPQEVFDIFAGQQLVVVGRYRKRGDAKMKISGKVGEETTSFEYSIRFNAPNESSQFSFAAKLWALRRIGEIIDLIDLEGHNQELVNELVHLSTKHGILTPYTSYLADDMAAANQLSDISGNRRRVLDNLGVLGDTAGQSGFAQRNYKQQLKMARGGGGGGFGGGANADAPAILALAGRPGFESADAAEVAQKVEQSLRYSENEAVYKRGKILIASNASDIDPDKDKDKIVELKRFSKEYFEVLKKTTKEENQLLALQDDDEELIVRLQGKVYRIK